MTTVIPHGVSGQAPRRLLVGLLVSIALHSALLAALQPGGGGAAKATQPAFLVRLESERPAPPQAAATPLRPTLRTVPASAPEGNVQAPPPVRYYRASELDRRPSPLSEILPEFPAQVLVQRGRVQLRMRIDERGVPAEVSVVRSDPAGAFDESARRAFEAARYSPGIRGGEPVPSELLVEVEYEDPRGSQARFGADRRSY